MKSWGLFLTCAILGAIAVIGGLMVPAHLRSVDDTVLAHASKETPGLVNQGLAQAYEGNFGAAYWLMRAAQLRNLPGRDKLEAAVLEVGKNNPLLRKHGTMEVNLAGELLESSRSTARAAGEPEPFAEFVIRTENRERALRLLELSSNPAVQELLRFRSVTNTTLFPSSQSASGQALDAALVITGLLTDTRRLSASLSNSIITLAGEAVRGGNSRPFEQVLMDILSIGQRMNWGQLSSFLARIDDVETLRLQANLVRRHETELPILFSAVQLSSNPAGVANYLTTFGNTGLRDVGSALRYGAGGINELLQRNQRLSVSPFHPLFVDLSLRAPWFALAIKWLLYIAGGFFVAVALHFALPGAAPLERPLQVRGFYIARAVLFGLGALLVVLLLSEPYLAQESQRVDFPIRLQLPTVGSAAPAGEPAKVTTFMNPEVLITMLIFFVLQALLYVACLLKLAEIRRQKVAARMKLRLLENEEHLFDAGLYLGFLGTIISLILVSLGVFKQPSLMAAYSATSFGILFVVVFKVVHLRPTKRKLLLEAEATPVGQPAAGNPFTAPL